MSFAPTPHVGLPDPLAVYDLVNGVYSIDGVPKVQTDLYTPGFTFPGDSATVGIITDIGFEANWVGGGTGTTASASMVATAGLDAILDPVLGYSGVIDVSAVMPNVPITHYTAQIIWSGGTGDNFASLSLGVYVPDYDEQYVFLRTGSAGDDEVFQDLAEADSGQNYRVAFSISAAGLRASVNGGPVVSSAPYPANYTVGFTPRPQLGISFGSAASVGGKSTFKGVTYYPLVTSSDGLKRLSS